LEKAVTESPDHVCHAMQLVQKARQKTLLYPEKVAGNYWKRWPLFFLERLLWEDMS